MGDERLDQQQPSDRVLQARARRLYDELRATLDELDRRRSSGRHTVDRPKLRVINGGKAVIVTPFVWMATQLREHTAQAATAAAVGVVAVPATLGVAGPEFSPNPVPRPAVVDQYDSTFHAPLPSPREQLTPAPSPTATSTAELPQDVSSPAPNESPTPQIITLPTPTPTPTLPPVEKVVEPVEEVVWTMAAALAECRNVLGLAGVELRECVQTLLVAS